MAIFIPRHALVNLDASKQILLLRSLVATNHKVPTRHPTYPQPDKPTDVLGIEISHRGEALNNTMYRLQGTINELYKLGIVVNEAHGDYAVDAYYQVSDDNWQFFHTVNVPAPSSPKAVNTVIKDAINQINEKIHAVFIEKHDPDSLVVFNRALADIYVKDNQLIYSPVDDINSKDT